MRNKLARIYVRRVTGPRKSAVRLTYCPPFFFVMLIILSAILGFWLNKRIERAEIAHHLYEADHPPTHAGPRMRPPYTLWL